MIIICSKLVRSCRLPIIEKAAIVIEKATILAVGPVSKITSQYQNRRTIILDNAVVLPGLVNTHAHLELPPLLDDIRAKTFPDWVINLVAKKKTLGKIDYRKAVGKNIQSVIESGTTAIAEICTHGESPALLKMSGLRLVIFQEIISMNPGIAPHLPASAARPGSLVQNGFSPHAPYTVSEIILTMLMKKKLPICMHVAESRDEIRLLQGKKSGFEKLYAKAGWNPDWAPRTGSPFQYLRKLGILGPRFLCVHAVQATDGDITILKKTRTPVAHCPRSNAETGVGRMPLREFLNAGITIGLGTDSLASSPSLSMWDEMRYAYRVHQRDGITAKDIFNIATISGAKALGLQEKIGTLEPGKKADLIAVPVPANSTGDLYRDLLRETKSCIMTMVNGKILYRRHINPSAVIPSNTING